MHHLQSFFTACVCTLSTLGVLRSSATRQGAGTDAVGRNLSTSGNKQYYL